VDGIDTSVGRSASTRTKGDVAAPSVVTLPTASTARTTTVLPAAAMLASGKSSAQAPLAKVPLAIGAPRTNACTRIGPWSSAPGPTGWEAENAVSCVPDVRVERVLPDRDRRHDRMQAAGYFGRARRQTDRVGDAGRADS